jgi:hypothetical protein
MHIYRRSVIVALTGMVVVGCSSGGKRVASSLTTRGAPATTTTTTTRAQITTTTTALATTTTTTDNPDLMTHLIDPPAGYEFAASLGNTQDPNTPGGSSGQIGSSDFSTGLGVPAAATTLHFETGYGQFYHYAASPPNSTVRDLEVDLFQFDGAADAAAFVQQATARAMGGFVQPTKTATVVSGLPAFIVNDHGKAPDGTYQKTLIAAHNTRAMQIFYGDTSAAPASFLTDVGALEQAKL